MFIPISDYVFCTIPSNGYTNLSTALVMTLLARPYFLLAVHDSGYVHIV